MARKGRKPLAARDVDNLCGSGQAKLHLQTRGQLNGADAVLLSGGREPSHWQFGPTIVRAMEEWGGDCPSCEELKDKIHCERIMPLSPCFDMGTTGYTTYHGADAYAVNICYENARSLRDLDLLSGFDHESPFQVWARHSARVGSPLGSLSRKVIAGSPEMVSTSGRLV